MSDLRARRKAAKLSQQKLAELAGCSISMVSLIENGYSGASAAMLERIDASLAPLEQP